MGLLADGGAAVDTLPRPPDGPDREELSRIFPVLLLVVLTPVTFRSVLWAGPGDAGSDPNQLVAFTLADVALALAVVAAVPRWRVRFRPQVAGMLTAGLAVALTVALAVNPSPRGFELAWRLLGVAATATLVAQAGPRPRRLLLATVLAVGALQAVLGIVQSATGSTHGLTGLEAPGFVYELGTSVAGRGGFGHPYHLAAFLLVAVSAGLLGVRRSTRPAPWLAGLALCGSGIGVTYGRGALLGLLGAVVVVAVTAARRRELVWGLAALCLVAGLGLGATMFGDGWLFRAEHSSETSSVDSGRRDRLAEAVRLIERSPLTGVGPGRYVLALRDVPHLDLLPAHNVVFHEAAEGGVVVGVLTAAVLLAMMARSLRSGADGLLALVPIFPFLVLDAYPYTFPTGLAMAGVWVGLLHAASRPPVAGPGEPGEPGEPVESVESVEPVVAP